MTFINLWKLLRESWGVEEGPEGILKGLDGLAGI